jgi:hypothetical protein
VGGVVLQAVAVLRARLRPSLKSAPVSLLKAKKGSVKRRSRMTRKILIQQVIQIRKKMRRKIRKRMRNRMSRKGSLVRAVATMTAMRAMREMLSNI